VNRIIGGLRPGCLYVIGARPGVGKTTFALQLAKHLTRYGAVSFSSLEMSRNDINMRVIAQDLKMDLSKLLDRRLTPSDWAKISERRGAWEKMPLMINDQSTSSVIDVQRHARSVSRRQPLAAVFVDYLQLMSQPAGYRGERHQFIADSSRQLKLLAMEMDIPVVALSQLNRGSESRADRVPQMSDLRESGAVEQDADVVTLMHREILGDNQMDLSLIVAKNRHGTTDTANLDFHGSISTVGDHGARVYDLPAARTPWRPDVDAQALAAGDH
jgi:replicative DNA helicase